MQMKPHSFHKGHKKSKSGYLMWLQLYHISMKNLDIICNLHFSAHIGFMVVNENET